MADEINKIVSIERLQKKILAFAGEKVKERDEQWSKGVSALYDWIPLNSSSIEQTELMQSAIKKVFGGFKIDFTKEYDEQAEINKECSE